MLVSCVALRRLGSASTRARDLVSFNRASPAAAARPSPLAAADKDNGLASPSLPWTPPPPSLPFFFIPTMSDVESDFDDLDELLPTFQQPKPATLAVASATAPANRPAGPAEPPAAAAAGEDDEDDEAAFAAAFERNMALMLAGLAGGEASSKETGTGSLPADGAWERAFNEALAGDASSGPAAAGSGNGVGSNADSSSSRSRSGAPSSIGIGAGPNLPAAGKADFKQTVRETVDRLKASSDGAGSTKGVRTSFSPIIGLLSRYLSTFVPNPRLVSVPDNPLVTWSA